MPPLAFLAAVTEQDQPMLLYIVIGGLISMSIFIANVLTAAQSWLSIRNNKSDTVTRAELQVVHARVDGVMPMFFKEFGKMVGELKQLINDHDDTANEHRKDVTSQLGGIQRSLGRVEGLENTVKEHGERLRDFDRNRNAKH